VLGATGIILILFAALGGVGYARSAARDIARTARHAANPSPHGINLQSADSAQYGGVKPIAKHKSKPPSAPKPKPAPQKLSVSASKPPSRLPFTGMSLLLPLLMGFGLVGGGLGLRRLSAERRSDR
jgi:hypothetical protein